MKIVHGGFTQSKEIERARLKVALKYEFPLILSFRYMTTKKGDWHCLHTFKMIKEINATGKLV